MRGVGFGHHSPRPERQAVRPENSKLLKLIVKEAAERGISCPSELEEVRDYCLRHAAELAPDDFIKSSRKSTDRLQWRRVHDKRVGRAVCKRYAEAFNTFERMLASAEIANTGLRDAWSVWYSGVDEAFRLPPIPGFPNNIFGGLTLKALLLIGMHARAIMIASEVLCLLRAGFPEGALARSRTIYELSIKIFLIAADKCKEEGGNELAERYYMSSNVELRRVLQGEALAEEERSVVDAARKRWGNDFFLSEHNWAAPVARNPNQRRLSFRDLEEAANVGDFAYFYREASEAVHAGALRIINSVDFRRAKLFSTGAEISLLQTGGAGQSAARYLNACTRIAVDGLTAELEEWDQALIAAKFIQDAEKAIDEFYSVYSRYEVPSSAI